MTTLVETITHGDIREIRMARAPVNALNPELCRQLIAALAAAHGDDVRGIVLSGSEGIFTAGMDVPFLLSLGDDHDALNDAWQAFFGVARALAGSRVPVVAAMGGHSPAGGCVLALCCDYRVMARSIDAQKPFVIGLNETQVGLVAPEGIQQLMRRVVGVHRAENLLVAGALVPAEHALKIGLVDELADAADVTPRALAWLRTLLALPHAAMSQTRAIARADLALALDHDNIRMDRFVEAWYAPETQAALRAMVDRLKK
ncbi:MAG: enoyl-CoA hydratase/isomerase family protein [Pseudoxanthomonas sp.]